MNKRQDILQELADMGSPLATMPRQMPYTVPDGYFSQLAGNTLNAAHDLSIPDNTPGWSKEMPYHVPQGYFESLTSELVTVAKLNATKETSLSVPEGYFEQLPGQILSAAKAADSRTDTGKVIALPGRSIFRPVQLAAAAVFILFVGIGSYITFFSDRLVAPEAMLASVTNKDLHDYLQGTYRIDIDKIEGDNNINNLQLDNKEIIEYLNETGWDVVD